MRTTKRRASRFGSPARISSWIVASMVGAGVGLVFPANVRAEDAAASEAGTKKVLVGKLKGAKPDSARQALTRGLAQKSGTALVGGDEPTLALGATESEIASVATESEADVVILGETALGKKGWTAELSVYDGADGHLIETVTVEDKSFDAFLTELESGEALEGPLASASGRPKAAPAPEPEPEPAPPVAASAPAASAPNEPLRPSPLRLDVGSRLYSRAFRYTESLAQLAPNSSYPELVTYNLAAAPMPYVHLEWYPAAHGSASWLSHVGLIGGFELGVGTSLVYEQAGELRSLSQDHMLWFAGLRGRVPLGAAEVGLQAKFADLSFRVTGDEDASDRPVFPDVDYKSIDLGGDFTWRFDGVFLGFHAKYLLLVDLGAVASDEWFPNAHGHGLDVGVFSGWELSRVFDLVMGVDGRSYGLDFNPIADDAPLDRIAGGASDLYLSARLGLSIKWPGDTPSAPAAPPASSGEPSSGSSAPSTGDDFDSFD